jgi:hypothetical protein
MVYNGHIRQGIVVLDQPVVLPEGLPVRVEVAEAQSPPSSTGGQTESPGQRLLKYAGKAVGLPSDAARNHDHYLYGTAKRPRGR